MKATAWKSASLGRVLALEGQYDAAWEHLSESLVLFQKARNDWAVALCLRDLGQVAQQQGAREQAARLARAAASLLLALDPTLSLGGTLPYDGSLPADCMSLNEAIVATAYSDGQSMTMDQAIAYVLEDPTSTG